MMTDGTFQYISAIARKYKVSFSIDVAENGGIIIRLATLQDDNSQLATRLISSEDAKSDSVDRVVRWNVFKMLKEIGKLEEEVKEDDT